MIAVGDVLKCTKIQYNARSSDGSIPDEYLPIWGLVVHVDATSAVYNIKFITEHPAKDDVHASEYNPDDMQISGPYDDFKKVKPDEWPDEVCAFVAKQALLGEVEP
jgi:hypothetical protein